MAATATSRTRDFSRLVRDSNLGAIREGSSNVLAIDVLRRMRKQNAHRVLADEILGALETCGRTWAGLRRAQQR